MGEDGGCAIPGVSDARTGPVRIRGWTREELRGAALSPPGCAADSELGLVRSVPQGAALWSPAPEDRLARGQVPSVLYSEVARGAEGRDPSPGQEGQGLCVARGDLGKGAQARKTFGTETLGLRRADSPEGAQQGRETGAGEAGVPCHESGPGRPGLPCLPGGSRPQGGRSGALGLETCGLI